ncbi:MAG: oxidoreductase [Parcubacteria group bacterium]|nr:oxidoreductase [Parcubacteria group bacterium]
MNDEQTLVQNQREMWFLPLAIIAAGLILAFAIFVIRHQPDPRAVAGDVTLMRPISEIDHIIGSPNAPIMLIEYSDIDSSYSKSFQQTMEQIMTEYAAGGKVAWVYRHLPLIDQHVNAATHAEAAECIASLGGQNIFWRFISALNAQAPGDQQFDPSNYDSVVSSLGVLPQSFDACMTAHTFQERVASDFNNGLAVGAGGSPFSILMVKGQHTVTIDGAVPYDSMKKILDDAITKVGTATST